MKKLWVASAITAIFLGTQAYGDTVTSVNVVGYVNLTVYGGAADTFTLIAAPMTKMSVAKGTISGNTTTTITDSSATWAVDTFKVGSTNLAVQPGGSTYYVEVTSGTFEGRHFYIASNDGTTLTLAAAMTDINAGDLNGQAYKIVPANRIRDIFGEPGSPALLGAANSSLADNIHIMNPSGWTSAIFYKVGGLGLQNTWIKDGVSANDMVVDRDIGLLVKREAGGANVELTVVGEVSGNSQSVVVVPGNSLINGMSAVAVPIGETGLTNALASGANSGVADSLYAWNGTQWSSAVFYKVGGLGLQNVWVQNGTNASASFMIQPGVAYLVKKAGAESDVWTRVSPLAE